jgi:hypothetical protein
MHVTILRRLRLEFVSHQVTLQNESSTAAYFKWLPKELPSQCYETVIFVPKYHYAFESLVVKVSDGAWSFYKADQSLYWRVHDTTPGINHWITISVKSHGKRRCCAQLQDSCSIS